MNDNLISVFKKADISIYQLAKQTGIPYTNLFELFHGKKSINDRPASVVMRLAAYFGCPAEELLDPIHYMDGVSQKIHGVNCRWRYDGTMYLDIQDGDATVSMDTGLQMTAPSQRRSYYGVADTTIQYYLKQKEIKKEFERMGIC